MKTYTINYFEETTVNYFGTLSGAIHYAETFIDNLVLSMNGSIKIYDNDKIVAEQIWKTGTDEFGEYSEPLEWKVYCQNKNERRTNV